MKHLHLQFILASAALGLGFCFIYGALWTVHALPMVGGTPVATFFSAVVSCLIGSILLAYGSHGVKIEFTTKRKR